jgi:hypothetical protein
MRTRNRVALSVALSILVACAAAAIAAPGRAKKPGGEKVALPRYGMVVYSDLCVQDSGEFGGQRITVQRFAEVDTVIYEYTAGGLSWPLVASDVNIDPRGTMMYFTVQPPDEPERTISGKFSRDGETLTLDGGYCEDQSLPMTLAKVRDFGRKPKACRACPTPKKAPDEQPQDKPQTKPVAPKWEPAPPSQG